MLPHVYRRRLYPTREVGVIAAHANDRKMAAKSVQASGQPAGGVGERSCRQLGWLGLAGLGLWFACLYCFACFACFAAVLPWR